MIAFLLSLVLAAGFGAGTAQNVVLAPQGTPVHRLFVFLPGTGAVASDYHRILDEAAARGYAVIGLNYANRGTVNMLCALSRNPGCWSDVRGPRAADAQKNLEAALATLAQTDPGTWGEFYAHGTVAWNDVVIGGHSQGAGEAIWIAKEHRVAHACGFDSPSDGNKHVPVAAWLSAPSATPASAIVVATNTDDRISKFDLVRANVAALGLPPQNFIVRTIAGKGFLGSHNALAIDAENAGIRAQACFR